MLPFNQLMVMRKDTACYNVSQLILSKDSVTMLQIDSTCQNTQTGVDRREGTQLCVILLQM